VYSTRPVLEAVAKPDWKWIVGLSFTLISGGLMGALVTWWRTLPDPSVVSYSITTTSIGTDPSIKSAVPTLSLRIGETEVQALHIHTVDLWTQSGQVTRNADIEFRFAGPTKLFSSPLTESPSSLHAINCTSIPNGLKCGLGPLSPKQPNHFKVMFAADNREPPSVLCVEPTVNLVAAGPSPAPSIGVNFGVALIGIILAAYFLVATISLLDMGRIFFAGRLFRRGTDRDPRDP